MKIKADVGDIVEVLWVDSVTRLAWHSREDIEEWPERALRCRTVGYYVNQTDSALHVCTTEMTGGQGDDVGGPWKIPNVAIMSYRNRGKPMRWK